MEGKRKELAGVSRRRKAIFIGGAIYPKKEGREKPLDPSGKGGGKGELAVSSLGEKTA